MRKVIRKIMLTALAVLIPTFFPATVRAQATTLPTTTTHSVQLPIGLPSNCTGANACQFQVYRISGTCPSVLGGSAGWTLIATTAAQAASYTDNTVAGSTQYSYDVEAQQSGTPTNVSGPSNCQTVTTPFTPLPPVVGTPVVN